MSKPTPAQRRVLDAMAEGWRLSVRRGRGAHLLPAPRPNTQEERDIPVSARTFAVLAREHWVRIVATACLGYWKLYDITAAGRAALKGD